MCISDDCLAIGNFGFEDFLTLVCHVNTVCGFYCGSSVPHCCALVCGIWLVFIDPVYVLLLLPETSLWLFSDCLCPFSYLSLNIHRCSYVILFLSISIEKNMFTLLMCSLFFHFFSVPARSFYTLDRENFI